MIYRLPVRLCTAFEKWRNRSMLIQMTAVVLTAILLPLLWWASAPVWLLVLAGFNLGHTGQRFFDSLARTTRRM